MAPGFLLALSHQKKNHFEEIVSVLSDQPRSVLRSRPEQRRTPSFDWLAYPRAFVPVGDRVAEKFLRDIQVLTSFSEIYDTEFHNPMYTCAHFVTVAMIVASRRHRPTAQVQALYHMSVSN